MPTPTPTTSEFRFFLKLPEELQLHILEYLAPSDLEVLSRVSKCLNRIAQADNLWKAYFKKEYQTAENRQEYLRTTSPIKAFSNHPEAIRKEYLHLHPKTKKLVEISEGVANVLSRKRDIQKKTLEATLKGAAYATCVLFYPPLLYFVVKDLYYQDMEWVKNINRKYPEKVLDMLKNDQLLKKSVGLKKAADVVDSFFRASSETTTYFLQSEPLLRIYLEDDADGELGAIGVLQEIVRKNVEVLPQAVQSFLEHKELIEAFFNSPEDQAWIAQIATAVQQALPPSNAEAHTATIAGP